MLEFVDQFADEKSRCVYLQALTAFVTMDYSAFHANLNPNPHRYVPDDIERPLRDNEIFVDCGAFDGTDTIWFLERVGRQARAVHVIEPEFGNYRATVRNLAAYAIANEIEFIVPYAMGVGAESGFFKFTGSGQGVALAEPSSSDRGGLFVVRLDDLIEDATWIKLEVEGFELPALQGSLELIRRARATVSISVYHLPTDFLDILPFVITELEGHALYLRHSGLEPGTLCLTVVPK